MEPFERPTGEAQFYPSGERRRCRAACMCCWERKLRCTPLKCGSCLNCVEHDRQCIPRVQIRLVRVSHHLGSDTSEGLMSVDLTAMGTEQQSYMAGNHFGGMYPNPLAGPGMYYGGYPMVPQATVGIPINQSTMLGGTTQPSMMATPMDHTIDGTTGMPNMSGQMGANVMLSNGMGIHMQNGMGFNGQMPSACMPGQMSNMVNHGFPHGQLGPMSLYQQQVTKPPHILSPHTHSPSLAPAGD